MRWVAETGYTIPSRAGGTEKDDPSPAIRRSAASASSHPPPWQ